VLCFKGNCFQWSDYHYQLSFVKVTSPRAKMSKYYKVSKVLAVKSIDGRKEYRVRWSSFGSAADTEKAALQSFRVLPLPVVWKWWNRHCVKQVNTYSKESTCPGSVPVLMKSRRWRRLNVPTSIKHKTAPLGATKTNKSQWPTFLLPLDPFLTVAYHVDFNLRAAITS